MGDKPRPEDQPGGFFGRARRSARASATKPPPTPSTHVLRCPDCGAAREGTDLSCRYCGGRTTE